MQVADQAALNEPTSETLHPLSVPVPDGIGPMSRIANALGQRPVGPNGLGQNAQANSNPSALGQVPGQAEALGRASSGPNASATVSGTGSGDCESVCAKFTVCCETTDSNERRVDTLCEDAGSLSAECIKGCAELETSASDDDQAALRLVTTCAAFECSAFFDCVIESVERTTTSNNGAARRSSQVPAQRRNDCLGVMDNQGNCYRYCSSREPCPSGQQCLQVQLANGDGRAICAPITAFGDDGP